MTTQLDPTAADAGPGGSPYRGLMPYTEADAEFFFGRDVDILLIANNARAYRFALLYGPSGVGKSSVLQAGVVRHIRAENQARLTEYGAVETVVAYLKEWRTDPYVGLVGAVKEAFEQTLGSHVELGPGWVGEEAITRLCDAHDVDLLLILDQFEEFFLYHRVETEEFAESLARLIAPSSRVNVLVAIREDALAKLDEFESAVPGVFDNTLRLEHLDEEAARAAITEPLRRYNARLPEGQRREVEPALVDALLHQVQAGRVRVDAADEAGAESVLQADSAPHHDVVRIEAPYLQLVLTRLWDEELARGSSVLRLSTLDELGGAQEIVRQHLDRVMSEFDEAEVKVLADAFGLLVTPSGSKIAHRPSDLAELSGNDPAVMAEQLRRLGEGDQRILREVPAPMDEPDAEACYEIFHDVLALAVLDWRRRYLADAEAKRQQADLLAENERVEQETREAKHRLRRARLLVSAMALLLVACLVLVVVAVTSSRKAQDEADRADENAAAAGQALALDELHRLLDTDPSAALASAAQGWNEESSPDYQDAFREALDAADTDVRVMLGSPVIASFFVGGDLVAVTEDGMVRRWTGAEDEGRYRLEETEAGEPGMSADVTPNAAHSVFTARLAGGGAYVVVTTDQSGVHAVDLESGDVTTLDTTEFPGALNVAAPVDGGSQLVAVFDYEGHALLWDVTSGEVVDAPGLGEPLHWAAVDPTGKFLAVAYPGLKVKVWNLDSGRRVGAATMTSAAGQTVKYSAVHFAQAQRPTLQVVVTGSYSELFTWDVLDEAEPAAQRFNARVYVDSGVLADGVTAVAADKFVGLVQADQFLANTEHMQDWVSALDTLPGSPASQYAFGGRQGEVHLYQTGVIPPHPLARFRGHRGDIWDIDFSEDGRFLVTGSQDGSVRVWRLPARRIEHHQIDDWMLEANVTGNGDFLFGSTVYGNVVRVDLRDPEHPTESFGAGVFGLVSAMSPSPDGSAAVLSDAYCDFPVFATFDGATAPTLTPPTTEQVSRSCYWIVAWSPDSANPRILAGTGEGKVVAWDAESGAVEYVESIGDETDQVVRLAISGDGSAAALTTGSGTEMRIHVRATDDGAAVADWVSPDVDAIAISHDGRYVAASSSDEHVIRVWEVADVQAGPVLTLEDFTGTLGQVSFSPDVEASRIAVGTSSGTVYVWDRGTGRLLGALHRHADAANDVVFTDPDDLDQLASAGDDGDVVSYTCEVCSLTPADLKTAAEERLAQVIDLR